MTRFTTEQRLSAAVRHLELAIANDSAADARVAYKFIGRAQAESDTDLSRPPSRELISARLGQLLTAHVGLVARAAVNVAAFAQDDNDLESSLLARSGYQVLLDAGIWEQPPLSDFHLADTDDALAEALAESDAPVHVPPGIPASHTWWRTA